ncbi:MAG: hypothetical protein CL489_06585 [Acidobacteria bacterium]|nr:hypothetical protein [Acidobacteriota bacterium]|tara:strand:+ start:2437 stop:2868 length:432 start_codon:yes stop_codon:yes gene_type:complete
MPQNDDQILLETIEQIQKAIETAGDKVAGRVKERVGGALGLFDKAKDNIAWVLGLPAAFAGSFGFLWDSSGDEAALTYQVQQLEEAVAELKSENDLLGGGTKNFSLDMSQAPGGSITVVIIAAALAALIGLLIWYQSKRRRRR